MFFELLDECIAEGLCVDVETYIETIESMPKNEAEYIIETVWDNYSEYEVSKAKKVFNKYKIV